MKKIIIAISAGLISMCSYADSPYWTNDVNERFKVIESGHSELANALRLITGSASKQCNKQLNDEESIKISKHYQVELHQLSLLLKESIKKCGVSL